MSHGDRIEMRVDGLVFDPLTNTPIIILKDASGGRTLPIWVGYPEATAIALEMETVATPRPMTHDLLKNILGNLEVLIEEVAVTELKDNTFYAVIMLRTSNGHQIAIDARPSDSIALALRAGCPIYVHPDVLENAKNLKQPSRPEPAGTGENPPDEEPDFRRWLDNIRPSDF